MAGKQLVDETGGRYGKLAVLARAELGTGGPAKWKCICDCGRESVVFGQGLRAGRINSCGKCTPRGKAPLPGDEAAMRIVYSRYKYRAARKKIKFDLSVEQFREMTSRPCEYCGSPPSTQGRRSGRKTYTEAYVHNGIDRVDSSKGYTQGNMVPCCQICNTAKMDRPLGEFLSWIKRLKQMH